VFWGLSHGEKKRGLSGRKRGSSGRNSGSHLLAVGRLRRPRRCITC
jgi:hypothetical protein